MSESEKPSESIEVRDYQGKRFEVVFRKAMPIDVPEARYPGFKPGVTTFTKGTVTRPGALALPCDILFERDVPITLRDGVVIYTDIFRPPGKTSLPAIIAWGPYGKEGGLVLLDDFPGRAGVPIDAVSGLQKWEGSDPAYWCQNGYAVVHPDSRGAFSSQGNIQTFGTQDGRDGFDVVEWVAAQKWSNGKVAFSGNSWLAISQWFIAAEQPPHLAAIAPWEGLCDQYREDVAKGGITDPAYCDFMIGRMRGKNYVEDLPAMLRKHPLMNAYWEDKAARLEKINVPAYIVASWTSPLHTLGTVEGFRRISSRDKWLRVHNTLEWPDYYTPENVEDLRRFFDRYLKGIENGWEQTPRVRLAILDPGGADQVNRPEKEFPLARTDYRNLYLDGRERVLVQTAVKQESAVHYVSDDQKGQAVFTLRFERDTELTGYIKLRLWAEATDSNDMDLFVYVQKLDAQGKLCTAPGLLGMPYMGASGRLRVSHRQTDPEKSTPWKPYLTHRKEELLQPGQIVPVEIPFWPVGMFWHAGQQLRLVVSGYSLTPGFPPGIKPPLLRNKGDHIIHTGGKFDSYLLVPVISG